MHLHCDPAGEVVRRQCIALAEHGHFAGRSKHIHLRWLFISDFIGDGILKLHRAPTTVAH